jgi:hypothetical protein
MGFVIALRDFSDCAFMDAVFVFEKLSISNNLSVKVKAGKKKILARKRKRQQRQFFHCPTHQLYINYKSKHVISKKKNKTTSIPQMTCDQKENGLDARR